MALTTSELDFFRKTVLDNLPDVLNVYRKSQVEDDDPDAMSDGGGGIIGNYQGAVEGKAIYKSYPCRITMPRGASSQNEELGGDQVVAYNRVMITVPWDSDIDSADEFEVISSSTGRTTKYEAKEIFDHTEAISLRISAVRI